ncbi:MAG: hypothetical protein CMM91_05735 [Rickettsiales bacterium]|nr:hypothetical protein [Rickettsiales bacterium]
MDASIILLLEEIKKTNKKVDKLQSSIDELDAKLTKHIGFIDKTYDGLRNPIDAAKKWLGK